MSFSLACYQFCFLYAEDLFLRVCYGLNVCVPLKLICWNLILNVMIFGGRTLGFEDRALMSGISAVIKETPGEGSGTPLQYSCLANPMDGGAWWAAVHGVTRSQTWLSDFTFAFHFHEKEMATHSSVLAWRIPGTGEPGGLLSMGSHRVRYNWSDLAAAIAAVGDYLVRFINVDLSTIHVLSNRHVSITIPSCWDLLALMELAFY